jgi:hypothetical protein
MTNGALPYDRGRDRERRGQAMRAALRRRV